MSSAEDWIDWARRKAEAASGTTAPAGQPPGPQVKGNTPRMANVRETPYAETPLPERQGNRQHQGAAPFAERQGNSECQAAFPQRMEAPTPRGTDEASPRRPGDPPWRGRVARRTSTPEAMAAFRDARLRRGWTLTRAARETGVSRPHLSLLERGLRRPSEAVAEIVIRAYRMTALEAHDVSEISVPWAGRDSPHRTGIAPEPW